MNENPPTFYHKHIVICFTVIDTIAFNSFLKFHDCSQFLAIMIVNISTFYEIRRAWLCSLLDKALHIKFVPDDK